MKPFLYEVQLTPSPNVRILGVPVGSNGLPSGHTDLNSGHPGMCEYFFCGVLVAEVSFTSLSPEMVQYEVPEDVQRLSQVSESASVVGKLSWGVFVALRGSLPRRAIGQVISRSSGVFHFFQIFLQAFQASCAMGHSSRQCREDSSVLQSQILHWGEIPISCGHVPTGRPWLKVSQMRVPTFLGRALCQILAIT